MQSVGSRRTRFGRAWRRALGFRVKSRPGEKTGEPVTLGGQRRSDGGARQVFGDGMHGRSCGVNQGDLSRVRWVFIAPDKGTKSRTERRQSSHISEKVG